MKVRQIFEGEPEVIVKDKSFIGTIARSLIQGSTEKLYREGRQPTIEAIREMADKGANNLLVSIMKAVDAELMSLNAKQTNRI